MSRVKKLIDKAMPLNSRQKVFRTFSELERAMYFSRPPKLDDIKESRGIRLSSDETDNSYSMGEFLGHNYILVDRHSHRHSRKTLVIEVDLHTLYPFNHFIVYKNDLPPDYFKQIQKLYHFHRPAPIGKSSMGLSRSFNSEYTVFSKPEHFSRSMYFIHDAPSRTLMDMKSSTMMEVSNKSLLMYDYSQDQPTPHGLQVFARTACSIASLLESRIK